jgi:hypothetical protein
MWPQCTVVVYTSFAEEAGVMNFFARDGSELDDMVVLCLPLLPECSKTRVVKWIRPDMPCHYYHPDKQYGIQKYNLNKLKI